MIDEKELKKFSRDPIREVVKEMDGEPRSDFDIYTSKVGGNAIEVHSIKKELYASYLYGEDIKARDADLNILLDIVGENE